jgi:hypothetical protein
MYSTPIDPIAMHECMICVYELSNDPFLDSELVEKLTKQMAVPFLSLVAARPKLPSWPVPAIEALPKVCSLDEARHYRHRVFTFSKFAVSLNLKIRLNVRDMVLGSWSRRQLERNSLPLLHSVERFQPLIRQKRPSST